MELNRMRSTKRTIRGGGEERSCKDAVMRFEEEENEAKDTWAYINTYEYIEEHGRTQPYIRIHLHKNRKANNRWIEKRRKELPKNG